MPHRLSIDTTFENETIIVDNNTGLQWQKDITNEYSIWEEALAYCENLTYGGYGDWRVPTPHEFQTITDSSRSCPAIDTTYFKYGGDLWTSKTQETTGKVLVFMPWGGDFLTSGKTGSNKTMCVRGEELFEANLITTTAANGDTIVSDLTTNLMWQKSYEEEMSWHEALNYCENLNYAGYSDWRLPNINELMSLTNYDKFEPASDFPDMPDIYFLSSTSSDSHSYTAAGTALFGYFSTGLIGGVPKDYYDSYFEENFSARCVRNSECNDGYFLSGSECAASPCTVETCQGIANSTEVCSPINAEQYSCKCISNYFWNGSECVTPCTDETCQGIANSTGVCAAISIEEYSCKCNPNYFWNGSECVNPCASDIHSNGASLGTNLNDYSCDCINGYYWSGAEEGCAEIANCKDLYKCFDSCGDNYSCQDTCYEQSSAEVQNQYDAMMDCYYNCNDYSSDIAECMIANCPTEFYNCYEN